MTIAEMYIASQIYGPAIAMGAVTVICVAICALSLAGKAMKGTGGLLTHAGTFLDNLFSPFSSRSRFGHSPTPPTPSAPPYESADQAHDLDLSSRYYAPRQNQAPVHAVAVPVGQEYNPSAPVYVEAVTPTNESKRTGW